MDLILLIAAIHLLARTFEGFFFSIPELAPYLTSSLVFFYFVVFNGPFGRGQTIGKMTMQIKTTDYDGQPLSWRAATIRTVTLFPVFVTVPFAQLLLGDTVEPFPSYLYGLTTNYLLLAVLLATVLVIPFNPFKQGMHDYFAETLVVSARPGPTITFDELKTPFGMGWQAFHKQPQYSGFATVGLAMVLLAVLFFPGSASSLRRQYLAEAIAMREIPGFEGSYLDFLPMEEPAEQPSRAPESETAPDPNTADIEDLIAQTTTAADQPTTGPLRLVLQVSRTLPWSLDPETEQGRAAATVYLQRYHTRVFSKVLALLDENGGDALKAKAAEWRVRPIRYQLILAQRVSLNPYPFIYREQGAHFLEVEPLVTIQATSPPPAETNP
jgi:uncharacterized RDD family membrane protein YckC